MVGTGKSALGRLRIAKDVGARLAVRLHEVEDEENQILQRLHNAQRASVESGELVPDAEALIAADGPTRSAAAKDAERLVEVRKLVAELKQGALEHSGLIDRLNRDASKEIIAGAEGDRWRKAFRKLAKAVSDLAEADAEVAQVQLELQAQLPDPTALMTVRFPPGPRASFEPGDVGVVATRFTERLLEVDRHYGS